MLSGKHVIGLIALTRLVTILATFGVLIIMMAVFHARRPAVTAVVIAFALILAGLHVASGVIRKRDAKRS